MNTAPAAVAKIKLTDYFDLTQGANLDNVTIKECGYTCNLEQGGRVYLGFLLAKSQKGEAFTICDVDFRWSNTDRKYATRLTLRRTDQKLQDRPVKSGNFFQRIALHTGEDGYREFWRMVSFLGTFNKKVDVGGFWQEFRAVTHNDLVTHIANIDEAKRLPAILDLAKESGIHVGDIENGIIQKNRQDDVEIFRKLLCNEGNYRIDYRSEHKITKQGDEAVWHHFLEHNKWVFGLSLDLRFIEDILDEQSVGNSTSDNKGNPSVDMVGLSDYTVLIELKTPETDIFTKTKSTKARTNTWSFTEDFIEGFSQCLAQKSDWSENHTDKKLIKEDDDGKRTVIDQGIIRTVDPQAILIIGNKDREIPRESRDDDVWLKRDTLERFIKNNRNINIISYDELFKRAYYIAHHKKFDGNTATGTNPAEDPWADLF